MIDRLTYLFEHAGASSEEWQHISYLYGYFAIDYDRQFQLGLYITLYCSCFTVIYILVLDYLRDFFDKGGLDMFKKISVLLFICLVILISVPSVPAFAAEGDSSGVRFYTTESVDGFFTGSIGSTSKQDIASYIYTVPNSFVTSDIVSALNNFPSDPNNGNSSPLTSGYWFVCVNSSLNSMVVFWPLERFNNVSIDWSSASPLLTANTTGDISFNACFSTAPSTTCYMMQAGYNFNTHTWGSPVGYTMTSLTDQDNIFNFRVTNLYGNSVNHLLSCSDTLNYLYSETQYQYETQGVQNSYLDFITSVYTSKYNYVNFLPATLPYYDGSEIITPDGGEGSEVESNENHLTLSNFNIQFCKPFDLNDLYSRAGGGYAAFTYDFDSWVNSHSSDYQLNIITQIDVDGNSYTFPNVRNLDVSGVLVLPFSGLAPSYQWSNENLLFVQYPNKLFGNYYLGYIYSLTYQKYASNAERFLGSGRSNRLFFKGHNVNSDFPDLVGSQVEELFSSVTHSKFQISFTVTMVDTVSGERSGSYVKTFDLLNGVYNVTSNTIQDNSNPFEYSDENPFLPVDNSGGGYLPSTNNNLVTNNINIPSDYTVTYRDGVNSFIDWFDKDPEVTGIQNSFWGAMGVFKGNPANELYSDYFGFLPDGFKSIIFGCAGIGIIGGAATVLRKRIMK